MSRRAAVTAVAVLLVADGASAASPHSWERGFPWSLHPRRHAAYRLQQSESPIVIDGRLNDAAWENVPFTATFMDISGPRHWSQPWFPTRAKLRYDHDTLYVAGYIEDRAIWANETRRNAVIFHDNDFEVFLDADGSTHNYKEIEVNAFNATWNLWLNKPYRSGGHENSTRVDPVHGFDMYGKGFRSAVHTEAPINDPSQRLHYWTVEMALPLEQVTKHTRVDGHSPTHGSVWRINFSRVQWQVRVVGSPRLHYEKLDGVPEANWVWSPQYAVNMHRPEWWGYLHFRDEAPPLDDKDTVMPMDPLWPLRVGVFQFFYAQEAFKRVYGRYALELDDQLAALFPIQQARKLIHVHTLTVTAAGDQYEAQIHGLTVDGVAVLRSDSFLTISPVARTLLAIE